MGFVMKNNVRREAGAGLLGPLGERRKEQA